MPFVCVGGTSAISDRYVRHEVTPARHIEMFFLTLFVPIADLAGAVKSEAGAAVGREESHLLARKQGGAINDVAQSQRAGTTSQANVNNYLKRQRPISNPHPIK